MQLNVVEVGTPTVFDYILYPQQHPGTMQYLQNQYEGLSATMMESGRKFFEDTRDAVRDFCDGTLERAARATIRMARTLMNPNSIQYYTTLEDIQSASPLMQRYIMAEPYIREKYHQQQCSGYADTYIDLEPKKVGVEHYDYRRVYNGVVRFEGEGKDEQWVSTTYFEDLREGDRELLWDEKVNIITAHEVAKLFAQQGQDPTCPYGSEIG